MNAAGNGAGPIGGRHDFDFIFGGWKVRNRKLRDAAGPEREEWIEFDTAAIAQPVLGGLGHFERTWSDERSADGPWEDFTFRQFDPARRLWSIWRATSNAPGRFGPPLTGRFADGVGTFTGADTIAGRPVKVRFEWVNPAPRRARWTQAFSFDAGRSWNVVWIKQLIQISRRKPSDHRAGC